MDSPNYFSYLFCAHALPIFFGGTGEESSLEKA
jgi:hypothetical protein